MSDGEFDVHGISGEDRVTKQPSKGENHERHLIITASVVIDDLMTALKHKSHPLAQTSDAEVLNVAIVAAKYFQNHHERALCVMRECNYLSGPLSISCFNRRLHALGDLAATGS
ncbi:MAG: hypothetical protein KGS73_16985 [Chloroflexi bacterium]|nr:hypothetical protein [Chloroflexota bacterium]